jgi:hypothetical protein
MARGVRITTERFDIPRRISFRPLKISRYHTVRRLAPFVIEHYLEIFPDEQVRAHIRYCCHAQEVYDYLATRIIALNEGINDPNVRIWGLNYIIIPTPFNFLSSVFPVVRLTDRRIVTLRTSPNWGALNNLQYAIELENIAAGIHDPVEFADLSDDAQSLIVEQFHRFKIHSSNDEDIPEAIKVFRREFLGSERNNLTTMIDPELLHGINDAREEEWCRSVYYERVTVSADGNDTRRYYPRLGVRPIIPRYNQQGTNVPQNVFIAGNWGGTTTIGNSDFLMRRYGCVVAFVANVAYTHIKRHLAITESPDETLTNDDGIPLIDPLVITTTNDYFHNNANMINWAAPLNTLGFGFPAHETVPRDNNLTEAVIQFNRWMNNDDDTIQCYIAIRFFITGVPDIGDPRIGSSQHWVGVNELVVFPMGTSVIFTDPVPNINPDTNAATTIRTNLVLPADTLYFRISPTSENDFNQGTAVRPDGIAVTEHATLTLNNRSARGWQFRPNGTGSHDIYVPLTQVIEYRIIRIPNGQ